ILGGGCAYALLIPVSWGDGVTGAFDVFRKGDTFSLTDYRRTEFFGGREDYQGALCGVFVSVDAVCDALADLVGAKPTPAIPARYQQPLSGRRVTKVPAGPAP